MGLLDNKRALVVGVASNRSIAWGIAQAMHREGAQIALTYQNEGFKKRLIPLMNSINADKCYECDVSKNFNEPNSIERVFGKIAKIWDDIDSWWYSNQVQNARSQFCERYSKVSDNSVTEFGSFLKKISKKITI